MIVIKSQNDVVPAGSTMIHIMCASYVFEEYDFDGTTTITWPRGGYVNFYRCNIRGVIIVSGDSMRIGSLNNIHSNAAICGNVAFLSCCVRVSVLRQLCCNETAIYPGSDGAWSENELDNLGNNKKKVIYYRQHKTLQDEPRLIARMRDDYRFTATRLNYIPRCLYPRRRALVHSLLVMVAARDVKRVGRHSALRKLPRYMLMMCGEMLV